MKTKYKTLISDTVTFGIGSLGSKLVLFLLLPLYTNFLTEKEYGIADLVFSLAQFLVPILSLVVYNAVLRFAVSKDCKAQDVLLVGLVVVLIGGFVSVLITPIIGLYGAISEWKWYLCGYVLFNMLMVVEGNYLKAISKNKLFAFINIMQTLLIAILNIVFLVVFDMGVKGYLVASIATYALTSVFAFFAGNIYKDLQFAKFNPSLAKKMLIFSLPLIINDISWWVIHSANRVMIEVMVGAAALGVYTVASKIPALINMCTAFFSQAWNLSTIRDVETDNDTKFYSNIFYIYSVLLFGVCILINLIIKPFMSIYIGDNFFESWRYVPLLLVSASFMAITSYFGAFYVALKKSVNNMLTTLIPAVVNILLNIALIKTFGVWGAVITTTIVYFVVSAIKMVDIVRRVNIKINYAHYFTNILIVVIQSIAVTLEWHFSMTLIMVCVYGIINFPGLIRSLKKHKA